VVGDCYLGPVSFGATLYAQRNHLSSSLCRSINLGFRGRHLCRPDPSADSILPVDDGAYDQGVGSLFVSSSSSTRSG
jgi:hypothetical protein